VETYVLRIRLPDRPGALGLVASRIGSVGVDIIAIDILQRADGSAVDEFVVELEHHELVDLLQSEIYEVDGVIVEEIRRIYRADIEESAGVNSADSAGAAGAAGNGDS
jgi:ACT domain-containing protein